MIAVVTVGGERLYNSPSYEKILGYTPNEITETLGFEQVHPDDQGKGSKGCRRGAPHGRRAERRVPHAPQERKLVDPGINGEHHC